MQRFAPAVLALAGTALAHAGHEHAHKHLHERDFFYPNGTASAVGTAHPTGSGIESTSTTTLESTVLVYQTKTVVPVQQSGAAGASAVAANNNAAVSAGASSYAAYGSEACGATATVTETEVVTVTVGGSDSGATVAAAGTAATSAAAAAAGNSGSGSGSYSYGSGSGSWSNGTVASSSSVLPQTTAAYAGNYNYGSPYGASSSAVATLATSTASYAATSSVAASSSNGSGKRGLAYNEASYTDLFASFDLITWAYNWALDTTQISSGLEYVPMLWGDADYSTWSSNAQAWLDAGSTHLLGFNEPDMESQANMAVSDAVSGYIQYMNPFSGSASLGSPAVTNSEQAGQGLEYLESFLEGCGGQCDIDFLVVHWYAGADATDSFYTHVQDAIDLGANYGISKVWITEFQATGTAEEQVTFLQTVQPWLDAQPAVERYAYFMCALDSLLESAETISSLGSTYASS